MHHKRIRTLDTIKFDSVILLYLIDTQAQTRTHSHSMVISPSFSSFYLFTLNPVISSLKFGSDQNKYASRDAVFWRQFTTLHIDRLPFRLVSLFT